MSAQTLQRRSTNIPLIGRVFAGFELLYILLIDIEKPRYGSILSVAKIDSRFSSRTTWSSHLLVFAWRNCISVKSLEHGDVFITGKKPF